jgi:hypothetical protein
MAKPNWDDDDWVGEPPEGRHTAEDSDPAFWENLPAAHIAGVGLLIVVVIGVVLIIAFA